ncbi:MAG: S41 family peptidase [SAR202 cluster bacterium]|nr:S41 family peptidase [SAR202 cluster bacterium]
MGSKRAGIALIVLSVLALMLAAGCTLQRQASEPTIAEAVEEVLRALDQYYVEQDKVSREQLTTAAIRGMLEQLDDPYTAYLPPEQFKASQDRFNGEDANQLEGIGAEVTVRDGNIMILAPLPNSPAMSAGVQPGDIVAAVDGQSVEGMSLQEAVSLIRGPKGSQVTVRFLRVGNPNPFDLTITRDTIPNVSVTYYMAEPGIGYVRIAAFYAPTAQETRDALTALRDQGATALVLDLRNNTGGLVDSAVGVTSQFIPGGRVLNWMDGNGEETAYDVRGDGVAYDLPMVVLVNSFTASAAEIVTGALQDHDRATVVGTRTFGKGSVNLLIPLSNGGGLEVTSARWFSPDGRAIEGKGLEPDVQSGENLSVNSAVRLSQRTQDLCETYDEVRGQFSGSASLADALERLCTLEPEPSRPPERDATLDRGVAVLKQRLSSQ